jgi:hypothetical protein
MYSSGVGRWLTPDPAGRRAANPRRPQSWNRYAYALNNSTTLTDPLGLETSPCMIDGQPGFCTTVNVSGGIDMSQLPSLPTMAQDAMVGPATALWGDYITTTQPLNPFATAVFSQVGQRHCVSAEPMVLRRILRGICPRRGRRRRSTLRSKRPGYRGCERLDGDGPPGKHRSAYGLRFWPRRHRHHGVEGQHARVLHRQLIALRERIEMPSQIRCPSCGSRFTHRIVRGVSPFRCPVCSRELCVPSWYWTAVGGIGLATPILLVYLFGLRGWSFLLGAAAAWFPVNAPLGFFAWRLVPPKPKLYAERSGEQVTSLHLEAPPASNRREGTERGPSARPRDR